MDKIFLISTKILHNKNNCIPLQRKNVDSHIATKSKKHKSRHKQNETYISALQPQAREQARVPPENVNPRRPQGSRPSSRKGSSPPDCFVGNRKQVIRYFGGVKPVVSQKIHAVALSSGGRCIL